MVSLAGWKRQVLLNRGQAPSLGTIHLDAIDTPGTR